MSRRLLTIPGIAIAGALLLAALPAWLIISLAVDVGRRRRLAATRTTLLAAVYLGCEAAGLLASAGLFIWGKISHVDEEAWYGAHFRLQAWWGSALLRAIVRVFRMRLRVTGVDAARVGPYLLLVRHASAGDTLLAAALVSRPFDMHLRYVLKRELSWDPCLDVVGHRLPNVFVDRSGAASAQEIERVASLGRRLGARDGVLIYPEGTRFSPEKRDRVLARLDEAGDSDALRYAESLRRVLPPRMGGALALLEAAPDADIVICSHTGFEGTASFGDLLSGSLVGSKLRVDFRRIARSEVPDEAPERADWLRARWREVDAWVESHAA